MTVVHFRTGFSRRVVVLFATIALVAISWPTQAAIISYGNFTVPPSGVTYVNVSESSGTDPVPLYGPPTPVPPAGLDFDPANFVATANGGASDVTDGQLNYAI